MVGYAAVYFVLYVIEGIFFWKYCTLVMQPADQRYALAVTEIFYIVLFFITSTGNFEKNIFHFALIHFLCIYILYHAAWYTALLHAALTTAVMALGELLAICATMQIFPANGSELSVGSLILNDILSRLLYLIFLYMVLRFARKNRRVSVWALAVPALSISMVPLLAYALTHAVLKPTFGLIVSLSIVFLTMLNFIMTGVWGYLLKRNDAFASLQQDLTAYYEKFLEQDENRNIFIHDINKHLQSIQLLYKQGSHEKALAYIGQLSQSLAPEENVCVSDRTLLNAIMSRYRNECRQKNILFDTDIRRNAVNFMEESDLTALFCNLLDNALASTSLITVNPFIELNAECRSNGYTMITMVNSCAEPPRLSRTGQLLSTKNDTHRHGYGMRSIQRVVRAYEGKMQTYFNEENNTFHTIILLKAKNV